MLDAREFGLPQARERVFTISVLGGEKFQFDELIRTPMRSIDEFLEKNEEVPEVYDVTQPSVREVIGVTGSVRRATVIEDYAFTITTRQDRTPAQVIDCGKGRYRWECGKKTTDTFRNWAKVYCTTGKTPESETTPETLTTLEQ